MSHIDRQAASPQTTTNEVDRVIVYNVVLSVQWRQNCITSSPQNGCKESNPAQGTSTEVDERATAENQSMREELDNDDTKDEVQEDREQAQISIDEENAGSDQEVAYIPSLHVFSIDQQSLVAAVKRLFTNLLNTSGDDDFVTSLYGAKGEFIIGNVFMETEDHDCIKSLLFQSFMLPENEFIRGQFGGVLFGSPSSSRSGCVFFNDLLTPSSRHFVEAITTALQSSL